MNPDGTRVSAGRGWFLQRVEDGSGGAILAWSEQGFDGYEDLYAQRVTGAGHVAPGWPSFGVGVVVAPNGQWAEFSMAADGQEGRFAWRDDRGFLSSSSDIYAQRITGRERWPQGGSPTVCGSRPRRPGSASRDRPCRGGGAMIAYEVFDDFDQDVRVQHVTAASDFLGTDRAGRPADLRRGDQRRYAGGGLGRQGGLIVAREPVRCARPGRPGAQVAGHGPGRGRQSWGPVLALRGLQPNPATSEIMASRWLLRRPPNSDLGRRGLARGHARPGFAGQRQASRAARGCSGHSVRRVLAAPLAGGHSVVERGVVVR